MFANALKTFAASNISANYSISSNLTAVAGPWKIYPAKNKKTGKECSVFVFDKKGLLDAHRAGLRGAEAAEAKRAAEVVVERLKKEALALARLRHPGILEVVEPVEETRGGGLQFVAEAVTASLSGLLQEKDDQERGGTTGRASRYVTEEPDGTRRRREIEIDELEIQKGLLQISKALEFLHENAGLVHGNLTPDAILVNAKSDWKLAGLAFCSPADSSNAHSSSIPPINLREALRHVPSLPRSVQLNLDYTSPDFVLDNNITPAADMFSMGLLCIALYNSPHRSPIECHGSLTSYQRIFQSSSSIPNSSNNFLSSRKLPKELANHLLPRLITRRPAQRMNATEFQQSEFFNNTLVATIRFLDTFPAKTMADKTKFLRGLVNVLPSFPKSVMEKKILPALLEELKDKELISLILHNVFKIISLLPSGRRAFGDKVRPALKEIFVTNVKHEPGKEREKDPARDAGLMVVIEQLGVIGENCNGKEYKDDILPIIFSALDSGTPSLVDAALQSVPNILPQLDFSTIKNELFPVIATIFSRTNSLAIKIRGLQAFVTLCGGSNDPGDDGLDGLSPQNKKATSSTALDKFTMQEKIVPLIRNIKTKEPAVMMAALKVLRVVGRIADADFVAIDILPILWTMALGPLLNLKQFQAFMELIKELSGRVEEEHSRKLAELARGDPTSPAVKDDFMSFGPPATVGSQLDANGTSETDFESLVKGSSGAGAGANPLDVGLESLASPTGSVSSKRSTPAPTFSWSTAPAAAAPASSTQKGAFRSVTPDLSHIQPIAPATTQFSQPLQPTSVGSTEPKPPTSTFSSSFSTVTTQPSTTGSTSIDWSAATKTSASNIWSTPSTTSTTTNTLASSLGSLSLNPQAHQKTGTSSFSLPPPPGSTTTTTGTARSGLSSFSLAPPPGSNLNKKPSASSFGGLGSLNASATGSGLNSLNSLNSLKNLSTSTSTSTGMGMGMGMISSSNSGFGTTMAGGMSLSMQPLQPMNVSGGSSMMGMGMDSGFGQSHGQQQQQSQKTGLDKYESLL